MSELGARLKSERKRLGLGQAHLATVGNVSLNSQSNYELGKRCPDGEYLALIYAAGLDVQYILTGIKTNNLKEVMEGLGEHSLTDVSNPKDIELELLTSVVSEVMNAIKWHASLHEIEPHDIAQVISMMYNNYKKSGKKPRKDDPSVLSAIQFALAG